ncbi:hypothetical protein N752_03150 [Desulforamulus aquiferis]|nr:hypothetical protein [Desulforamulus aquiferis]RYD06685.1 hypothetical protein N752_03150 [Desulforamulus aquiferis]
MSRTTFILLITLFTITMFTGCASQDNEILLQKTDTNFQETYSELGNKVILNSIERQLPGSKSKDKIILYAEQADDGMPLSWSLVVDGIEMVKLDHEENLYGFAEVKFQDLDGDNKDEVLLYRQSSGSAGARGLNVYRVSDEGWEEFLV